MFQLINNGSVIRTFQTKEECENYARKMIEAMKIYTKFAYFPYQIKEVK